MDKLLIFEKRKFRKTKKQSSEAPSFAPIFITEKEIQENLGVGGRNSRRWAVRVAGQRIELILLRSELLHVKLLKILSE